MSEKIDLLNVVCEPEFSVVCGLLGDRRVDVTQIKEIYGAELAYLRGLVKPVALMKQCEVKETLILAGDSDAKKCTFEDKIDASDGIERVLVLSVLLTTGEAAEQYVRELFAQGEHLRALVADAMLSAWLFAMDEKMQDEIRAFCAGRGVGVAKRLEAPDDLSFEMQGMICETLDADRLAGVRVTETHMLVPEKSMCYVRKLTDDCDRFAA